MKKFLTIIKKKQIAKQNLLVLQIHNEFDGAQDRILCEADKMLTELQIPTETQIERKAALLEKWLCCH